MAPIYEGKRLREVREHKRNRGAVYVEAYLQRYDKPRGNKNVTTPDRLTKQSKTVWLKDKRGRFVGRANSKGKTSAKRIAIAGSDTTTNYRERGKYGRIYGRTSSYHGSRKGGNRQ